MGRHRARWRAWPAGWACLFALLSLALLTGAALAAPLTEDSPQRASWPEVLTLEEAAGLLRVSPRHLEDLAWLGQVPARRIGTSWRFSQSALLAWLAGWRYEPTTAYGVAAVPSSVFRMLPESLADESHVPSATLQPPQAEPLLPAETGQAATWGMLTAQADTAPAAGEEVEPIGEEPELATAEEMFLREQTILLEPGELTLELGLFYSRLDDQELESGAGTLTTIEDETFTSLYTARYGLIEDTQVFASIPFRYERAGTVVSGVKSTDTRVETGDFNPGVRHTILRERKGLPEVILTVEGRIPTVESSYAIGGGVALVKSVDPAALFVNGNYLRTFSRDFGDVTRLQPKDTFDVTLGYVLALNDSLTISTALSGVFVSETTFDAATIRQQELFSLQFGLTSFITEGLFIEPVVSFGLNGTGNTFVLGVSVPYTFRP